MMTAIALQSLSNFNLIQHVKTVCKPQRECSTLLFLLTKVDVIVLIFQINLVIES